MARGESRVRYVLTAFAAIAVVLAGGLLFAVATGTIHEYSNFGYAVLGRVVQRASGRRIQEVVSEELLPALGIHATTWTQPMHGDAC